MKRLHTNPAHYNKKVVDTYYGHNNHHEALQQWTEEQFESFVVKVLSERFREQLGDQTLRVLGIGGSEGYQEILQLKKLKTKFPKISATITEPSAEKISKYQDTVQQGGSSGFAGIDFEWHNQTFQDYMKSNGTAKKYHFISIVHAMYFLGDVEEAMRTLSQILEPGGVMMIILNDANTGIGKLSLTFPNLHSATTEDETQVKSCADDDTKPTRVTNSADILLVLDKFKLTCNHDNRSSYTESVDISTWYNQPDSHVADLLIDSLTSTIRFRELAPTEIFAKVIAFIRSNTRIVESDGDDKFYFDTVCDILVISKV